MSALNESPIVQLFETCDRLPQNHNLISNETDMCTSFAKMVCDNPNVLKSGQYHDHGHPGYVWAARKDILDKHGLYEFAIAGAADHYIAHASMNDMHSPCIHKSMFGCEAPWQDWLAWADSFHTSVQGKLGVVPGKILHLWHGDLVNRKYYLRYLELAEFNFNPYTDLIAPPGRPLEFKPGKPEMEAWFNSYFKSRLEDGDAHNQNETGGYAHG